MKTEWEGQIYVLNGRAWGPLVYKNGLVAQVCLGPAEIVMPFLDGKTDNIPYLGSLQRCILIEVAQQLKGKKQLRS